MAEIFTVEDGLVLLSALLGNRTIKILSNTNLNVELNDVVIHKKDNKVYLYNVIGNGTINNEQSDLLQLIDMNVLTNGGVKDVDVPAWTPITFSGWSRILRLDFWKRIAIIGPDFKYFTTREELLAKKQLSTDNPRRHITIYIKDGAKSHYIYVFDNLINMDGAADCALYISRN